MDAEGLHPLPEKVHVIVKAPAPQNVGKLKSLLGLLSYYWWYGEAGKIHVMHAEQGRKQYSQKEGLVCVVGVTWFHPYLYGYHFILQMDHKPLLTLFNEEK